MRGSGSGRAVEIDPNLVLSLPFRPPWNSQLSPPQFSPHLRLFIIAVTKTSSMITYYRKRFKNSDMVRWSDLKHEVLFIVLMKLGVVDFVSFSGVCKSWRSLALSNKNKFMVSKPPMSIGIQLCDYKDSYCYLEDFQGRRFRTNLPHSAGRICIGVTYGYLILFGRETRDFWLVNPITRHELHFPNYTLSTPGHGEEIRATLVFSPSVLGWSFVVLNKKMSFCYVGKKQWTHISATLRTPLILDLHAFKGNIYTLHKDGSLYELILGPKRKYEFTLVETENILKQNLVNPELVSSGENLYVTNKYTRPIKLLKLDIEEMKWMSPERTINGYAFFISKMKSSAATKPELWVGPVTPYKSYDYFLYTDKHRHHMFHYKWLWYFPHDCFSVNLLDRKSTRNMIASATSIAKIMIEKKKEEERRKEEEKRKEEDEKRRGDEIRKRADMSTCIEKLEEFGWDAQHPLYQTALLLFGESSKFRKLWLILKVEACETWIRNAGCKFGLLGS